jgi:PilZ domain
MVKENTNSRVPNGTQLRGPKVTFWGNLNGRNREAISHALGTVNWRTKRQPYPCHARCGFYMEISRRFQGRVERRLPIIIPVRLSRGGDLPVNAELTYTDNISLHGARVVSNASCQVGEHANIEPAQEGHSTRGEVVYCQSVGQSFCVGLKFQEAITWSQLARHQLG